jgi:UDP-glucose 4-epimerase
MKILVVGGAGYIGSHVVREFLDQEYDVTVFDNLSSGTKVNLFEEATFIEGDIRNYEEIHRAMALGFDGVIHLAAYKHVAASMSDPEGFGVNNISGTINLLNTMVECGVKHIVFSSSASVFGEPQYLPLDEEHPTDPESFYGFTKLEIERLLKWYDRLKNIKYSALRYFNAAGFDVWNRITGLEKTTANLLPVIMEVALGMRSHLEIYGDDYDTKDGSCIRDYIHVNDLGTVHVASLEYLIEYNKSQILNIGNEKGISVLEMLELSKKITGKEIPVKIVGRRPGDPSNLVATSKKTCSLLNWKPLHSDINTIVESTWQVYKTVH